MLSRHWAFKIGPSFSSYPELAVCLLSDELFFHPVLTHKGGRVGDSNRKQSPLDQKNEVTPVETCMRLWPLSLMCAQPIWLLGVIITVPHTASHSYTEPNHVSLPPLTQHCKQALVISAVRIVINNIQYNCEHDTREFGRLIGTTL